MYRPQFTYPFIHLWALEMLTPLGYCESEAGSHSGSFLCLSGAMAMAVGHLWGFSLTGVGPEKQLRLKSEREEEVRCRNGETISERSLYVGSVPGIHTREPVKAG